MTTVRGAATTWAIVVGIDEYDDAEFIKPLTGAARDAAAAVGWLRKVGVPDAQIALHAAPCKDAAAEIEQLGLEVLGCREPEIRQSITDISKEEGDRLFLFLLGHGVFEPTSGRVFLTQDTESVAMVNVGIDRYVAYLRTLKFREQFLVMDGCLNYPYSTEVRSKFEAQGFGAAKPGPPREEVVSVSCFAAAQGERALEIDGRGLFLSELLTAADPLRPNELALELDPTSGDLLVDVRRVVQDVAGPCVTDRAARDGRRQHPGVQVLGAGEGLGVVPLLAIEADATAKVTVTVEPDSSVDAIRQIRVASDDADWQQIVPVPPANAVVLPVEVIVPVATPLMVRCLLGHDDPEWIAPAPQAFTADADRDIRFTLEPTGARGLGSASVIINTVDGDGERVSAMSDVAYDAVETTLREWSDDVSVERHETGPVLTGSELIENPALLIDVMREINRQTPLDVGARMILTEPTQLEAALHFEFGAQGARGLAGFSSGVPCVDVAGRRFSLDALEAAPEVSVDAGPVRVRLDLPWGSWSSVEQVVEGSDVTVVLPSSVGLPPLRVELASTEAWWADLAQGVIVSSDVHGDGEITSGSDAGPIGALRFNGAIGRAELAHPAPRWTAIGHVRHGNRRIAFPLPEDRPLGVELTDAPRVEPLSNTTEPAWDALVSSGRLDLLDEEQAALLAGLKWDDLIIGTAAAYWFLARGELEELAVVVDNLRSLDRDLPDAAILEAELHARKDPDSPSTVSASAPLGVPLFRWGVPIAIRVAEWAGHELWRQRLATIERSLVPASIWTAWREDLG